LSKDIDPRQERIILGAARLSEIRANQVMIPITDAAVLSSTQSLAEALVAAHSEAHTRYPVCEADRAKIIGYINFKELVFFMRANPNEPSLRGVIRPVYFVEPSTSAADLLAAFIDRHEHIAVVREADGRCTGMITMEDIIEELVGELQDEFDRLPHHVHALSGGMWMFGGGVLMRHVASTIGLPLNADGGTLAAWLAQGADRPLMPGQVLRRDGVEFIIRRMRRGRVFEASATIRRDSVSAPA
jgi:putative hemolysin